MMAGWHRIRIRIDLRVAHRMPGLASPSLAGGLFPFLPNLSTGLPARRRTDARRCCMRVNSRAANGLRGPRLAGLLVSCSAVPVSSAAMHAVSRPVECVLGPGWQDSKAFLVCEHASAERRPRRRTQGAGCSRGAPFNPFDPFDPFDTFDWRRLRCASCVSGAAMRRRHTGRIQARPGVGIL